ncbi:Cytochrome c oxidase subunit 5A, mitochondrial, partial [Lemmus lemmus]
APRTTCVVQSTHCYSYWSPEANEESNTPWVIHLTQIPVSYTTLDTLWRYSLVYELKLLIMLCENAELNDFNSSVHTRKSLKDKAGSHKKIYHNAIQKYKPILNEL